MPHTTPLRTIMHAIMCIACTSSRVGGINFGDLVKNSPIRQIKIPAKVSGYTVCSENLPQQVGPTNNMLHLVCKGTLMCYCILFDATDVFTKSFT